MNRPSTDRQVSRYYCAAQTRSTSQIKLHCLKISIVLLSIYRTDASEQQVYRVITCISMTIELWDV